MQRLGFRALSTAAVLAALFLGATTIWAIVVQYQPFPCLDQWANVRDARLWDEGAFGWRELFAQHNEHRLAVPRVLFLIDAVWCGQSGHFVIAAALVLQGLLVWLLADLWRRARAVDTAVGSMAVPVVAVLVAFQFAGAQIQNLVEPFQVQFGLVALSTSCAFAALARAASTGRCTRWVLAAGGAGAVATYSMASGMLVWPLLLLCGAWLRLPRGALLVLSATAIVAIGSYLCGYHAPSHHTDLLAALQRPVGLAHYAATYLGSTIRCFDAAPQLVLAPIAGALGIVLLASASWQVARAERSSASAHRAAVVCIALFAVGAAMLTALGRLDFGVAQATNVRYGTTVLLFWSAILVATGTAPGARWRWLGLFACACVLACLCAQQRRALQDDGWARQAIRRQGTAVEAGVQDHAGMRVIGDPQQVFGDHIAFLHERHLSVFAARRSDVVGQRRQDALPGEVFDGCIGAIDGLSPVAESGWAFYGHGWAFVAPLATSPVEGWFVDARDVVVGLLDFDGRRSEVASSHPATAGQRIVCHGYGAVAADSGAVGLLVRGTDGRLYRGIAPRNVPCELAASAGAAIPGLGARPAGDFAASAAADGVGAVFACTGAGTGTVTFGPILDCDSLLVPLRTGPSPFGTEVRIVDRDTGAVLRRLWPATTHGQWIVWRAELPPSAKGRAIAIVAIDRGTRQSQSMAIGTPTRGDRGK